MFAARITAKNTIELVDVDEPTLTGNTLEGGPSMIFQPELTCLCGSDLPFFCEEQDEYPLKDGMSLHEMVGTVLETSGNKFKVGDRVLAVPEWQRGFYERYEVPEGRVIPLDDRQPPEVALMAQPLGTAIYALRKLPPLFDLDVVVYGQGPMGQIFNACLRNLGARQIIALDRVASRLERSRQLGATSMIDTTQQDAAAEVTRLTDGRMADVVIEAVGHSNIAINSCIPLCREHGDILSFGVPPLTKPISIQWIDLFMKNISIHTSVNPDFNSDFPLAMRWVSEGRIDMAPLITHRFEVAKIQEAFEVFRDKKDGAIKVLVDFPASGQKPPNGPFQLT